jgi:hypothetical protein
MHSFLGSRAIVIKNSRIKKIKEKTTALNWQDNLLV